MEPLFFIIVLILFWALPALLRRYRVKQAQEEAEERPEQRASLNEVRRFLRGLGLEEEERPEVPTLRRPPETAEGPPAPKPAEPSLLEEGRVPGRPPRRLVERPPRPAPEVQPLPGIEPAPRLEVKPAEEREVVPLLEAVSEGEPLVREAPRPRRVVRRRPPVPPRPVWAGKAAPPMVKKEVSAGVKILPVTLADLPRAVVMAEVLGRPRGFGLYRPYAPGAFRKAAKR